MNAAESRAKIRSLREAIASFAKIYCDEAGQLVYPILDGDGPYCPNCGTASHLTAYAENERCLTLRIPMHRGGYHGVDANGLADIEFPTLRHAASFVETLRDPGTATLRDAAFRFDLPVVVQVRIPDDSLLFPSAKDLLGAR